MTQALDLYNSNGNNCSARKDFLPAFDPGSEGCIHVSHEEYLVDYVKLSHPTFSRFSNDGHNYDAEVYN